MTSRSHKQQDLIEQATYETESEDEYQEVPIHKDDDNKPTSHIGSDEEDELVKQLKNTHIDTEGTEQEDIMPATAAGETAPRRTNDAPAKGLVPDPGWFDGDRAKFGDWWRSIKLFMKFNKIKIADDKIIACISRMKGGVAGNFATVVTDALAKTEDTASWDEFEEKIKESFIDGKEKENAENKLEGFVQGKTHITDYMIEFNLLKDRSGTDDQHAIYLLKKHVRKEIIRAIIAFPPASAPTTYKLWGKAIIAVGTGVEALDQFDK